MPRLAGIAFSFLLVLTGLGLVANHEFGMTSPGARVEAGGMPPAAAASEQLPPAGAQQSPPEAADRSGVPVGITIPFPSRNHPNGVMARVRADPLSPDGALIVPPDPRVVSWASEDAAPGAPRGTAILTGHVNFPVDGRQVQGAFSDLNEYAAQHVGATFSVVMRDGGAITYRITGGVEYDKDQLAAHPELRESVYNQTSRFGTPPSGRLVLVSCGGVFDNRTGSYQDNVFVFAVPVG